jgi:hypothetical protein
MLDNLRPAGPINVKAPVKPGVEFDGTEGEAVTHGYNKEPENFDEFLIDAGFDPQTIDVIPPIRTSRWQRYDGEWLTATSGGVTQTLQAHTYRDELRALPRRLME